MIGADLLGMASTIMVLMDAPIAAPAFPWRVDR
jgi:hypothetical protein